MIDVEMYENKLEDFNGYLETIKALNYEITNFINEVQDMKTDTDVMLLKEKAYRTVFFTHIIDEKANLIQSEIDKLLPCQQST